MRRFLSLLLASTALALAAPQSASAHERQHGGYSDWEDRDSGSYDQFYQELQHLDEGIQHGLSDGSIEPRDARQLDQAIGSVQQRLESYYRRQGYLTRWQVQDIQQRIDQLHAVMHEVHDEGHDAQEYEYGEYQRW